VSDHRASANTIALAGGIATGVSAVAFAAALFFWPRSQRAGLRSLVFPTLSGERAGVEVRGCF